MKKYIAAYDRSGSVLLSNPQSMRTEITDDQNIGSEPADVQRIGNEPVDIIVDKTAEVQDVKDEGDRESDAD